MAPAHRTSTRGRLAVSLALLGVSALTVLTLVHRAEAADDIELLRENGGNPYVMILLDTSASMALAPPGAGDGNRYIGDLVAANGDDPRSKIFQVKQALYEVFSQVENVSFGFAEFNKDHLRVLRKHWLYQPTQSVQFLNNFTYPLATPADPSDREKLETMWVFGDAGGASAGSCASPIEFSTNDRDNTDILLNRFPKSFVGGGTVNLWIEVQNRDYLLEVEPASGSLGDATIGVRLTFSSVSACSPLATTLISEQVVPFDLVTDFLMVEADLTGRGDPGVESAPAVIANSDFLSSTCDKQETLAGFFNLQDMAADGTCGATDSHPFTGRGADLNNDSGDRPEHPDPPVDRYCWPNDSSNTCYSLRFPTALDPRFPELDSGDFLPLNWTADNREAFLRRLNPRHPDYLPVALWDGVAANGEAAAEDFLPYFGVARYFHDTADPTAGIVRLRNEEQKPIAAFGNSPLARALNDFRCWYNRAGSNKCKAEAFPTGFEKLFQTYDDSFKCRIPYLITITDGEDNSDRENFAADYNDLDNDHGIRNWIFSFQDHPDFQRIVSNANAEVILVNDKADLKTKLEEVIGTITQATRTFATAAVPSVQAAVESRIYLTKFQPLNDAGVWEGHLHSFRLPMPQDRTDVPNSSYPNHIWDAAVSMLDQSPLPPSDGNPDSITDVKLGDQPNQRRVLWAREKVPGTSGLPPSPAVTRMFEPTPGLTAPGDPSDPSLPAPTSASEDEVDFWTALGVPFDPADGDSVALARGRANRIVKATLAQKVSPVTSETDDLTNYILGDIFHSNPLVIGGPVNTRYFIEDAEETEADGGGEAGTGYREYFEKHENRRKLLVAGANDGMLHAFEAGIPGVEDIDGVPEVRFTAGTGREIFSFIPTRMLSTVKFTAENPQTHRWGVDGSPAAGDVFIDPAHAGLPSRDDREWRTVVITGLREGGSGYFALDVTQPDPLTTTTIGPASEPVASREVSLIEGFPTGTDLADEPTENGKIIPGCYNQPGDGIPGCDDVEYPALLWEFTDRVWDATLEEWVALDEDENGFADLAETWSTPDIGRIKVVEDGAVVTKYVAVFGGGLDPAKAGSRGNWIYIVDVETGQALYKRPLEGSAPSDPAAVDTDQDGFYDRIYMGTTAGLLYRIDMVSVSSSGVVSYPRLVDEDLVALNGLTYMDAMPRIEKGNDSNAPLWAPRVILDAVDRPIYYPPAVLFVGELGEYAVALGTGDRDDLTSKTGSTGRFFVFVDESDLVDASDLPFVEADFQQIDREAGSHGDLLTDPDIPLGRKGWYLVLSAKERLIGDPFGFSGVTFFATFEPDFLASCQVTCPRDLPPEEAAECRECGAAESPECTLGGTSRVYVVGTTDADAFIEDSTGVLKRYHEIQGQFVTSPFTEQAVSVTPNTSGTGDGDPPQPQADPLSEGEEALMNKLKELFPERCRFGNHRIDIKVIQANSEIQRIAPVPICIVEKNWKEITQ